MAFKDSKVSSSTGDSTMAARPCIIGVEPLEDRLLTAVIGPMPQPRAFLPEIQDEALVGFECGTVTQPSVVGRLTNRADTTGFPYPGDGLHDVPNLNPSSGGNDSSWVDLDAPVMQAPDGRKYKMLVAPLILDLGNTISCVKYRETDFNLMASVNPGAGTGGDEITTDANGRVKVRFYWDRAGGNADNSCWVRVSSTWAGKQWGVIFIPRIGQEVIVSLGD